MTIYRGVNGVNRTISKIYRGVNGSNKQILKQYKGVNGVNKTVYSYIQPKYLYNRGTNYSTASLPYAYTSGYYRGSALYTLLRLELANGANNPSGTSIVSNSAIDVTNYQYLSIVVGVSGSMHGEKFFEFGLANSGAGKTVDIRHKYTQVSKTSSIGVEYKYTMDISDKSGSYYIYAAHFQEEYTDRSLYIYELYLE